MLHDHTRLFTSIYYTNYTTIKIQDTSYKKRYTLKIQDNSRFQDV